MCGSLRRRLPNKVGRDSDDPAGNINVSLMRSDISKHISILMNNKIAIFSFIALYIQYIGQRV